MERIGELIEGLKVNAPPETPNAAVTKSTPRTSPSQNLPPQSFTKIKAGAKESPSSADSGADSGEPINLDILWTNVLNELSTKLDEQIVSAWIAPLRLEEVKAGEASANGNGNGESGSGSDPVVSLVAPNRFCADHVQRVYSEAIRQAFSGTLNRSVSLLFRVEEGLRRSTRQSSAPASSSSPAARVETAAAPKVARAASQTPDETNLNPKYNFSNFVVGSCNQLAHAVGLKVAENLGTAYNPLFVYGGVGLGKTHLANAIGNSTRRRYKKVLLVSSELFVSELISSLRSSRMDQFKNKFRSLDLLIIDDIQFIIGKERTQEEFFHTFNDLYNRQKQIVITSDKVPQELVGLEERLKTRFASGLSVDLQAPDFETRVAILCKKAEIDGIALPEGVARLLAQRIDTNVRELEGALNRLKATSSLHKTPISEAIAEEVLRGFGRSKSLELSAESIQRAVAERFNVSLNDLLGKRRTQNIAMARQVAMYLCRRLTAYSYPEIGAFFGGRDHSTVIHAHKTIIERMSNDTELNAEVTFLERRFRNS